MAAAIKFLATFRTTPSQLVLELSWDNQTSALTSFSNAELSALGRYQANRVGSGPFLRFHRLLKSSTEAAAWTLKSSPYRNQHWDDNPDLFFWRKNCHRLGQSLLEVPYVICFAAVLS
jgi:hypothetical protein